MATDKRLIEDLNKLIDTARPRQLPPVQERGELPPARGYHESPPPAEPPPSGGGIASPLTEIESTETPPVQSRDYHTAEVEITSTDGMITFVYAPIARLRMVDANAAEAEFVFRHPVTGDLPT